MSAYTWYLKPGDYKIAEGVRPTKGQEKRAKDLALGHCHVSSLGKGGRTSKGNRKSATGEVGGKPRVWSHGRQLNKVYHGKGEASTFGNAAHSSSNVMTKN